MIQSLQTRRFSAGSIVIAEGNAYQELYIGISGIADIVIRDPHGAQQLVERISSGAVLGEASLLTNETAAATVRAVTDLDVLVVNVAKLEHINSTVHAQLTARLAQRVVHLTRSFGRSNPGKVIVLHNDHAPPLLAYALACSMAWHARQPTLLLIVHEGNSSAEITALTPQPDWSHKLCDPGNSDCAFIDNISLDPRAYMRVVDATGPFAPGQLSMTLNWFCHCYSYVLVHISPRNCPPLPGSVWCN